MVLFKNFLQRSPHALETNWKVAIEVNGYMNQIGQLGKGLLGNRAQRIPSLRGQVDSEKNKGRNVPNEQ